MIANTHLPLPPRAAAGVESRTVHRMPSKWLAVIALLVVGSCIYPGVLLWQRMGGSTAAHETPGNGSAPAAKTAGSAPGPWGQLECVPIVIAPPVEFLPEFIPAQSHQITWHFPNTSKLRLSELFSEIGLDDSLRLQLTSLAEVNASINGMTICPPQEAVLALSPTVRAKLYAVLGEYRRNGDQDGAFRFAGDSLEEWFRDSPVSPQTLALIRPLVYRHGQFLFFADLRSIESSLPSPEERLRLLKALSREETLLVKLRVGPDSDLDGLANYWGRGGRAKDVRPLLESLKQVEGGQSINITLLLPPFARRRIYTYPLRTDTELAAKQDCHWTAFNFFSEEPDNRLCDEQEVVHTLETKYYRIFGNLQLGDLVLLFSSENTVIHSAVFIADDILYTKNGSTPSRPWMLMKLREMKDFYPTHKPLEVRFFRQRDI